MNALFSMYNKAGLADMARELDGMNLGFRFYGSSGSAAELKKNGLACTDVAELIGTAPLFGHRVATLSWQIHGGILVRDQAQDMADLEALGLPRFDLVCVDMYPLEAEIKNDKHTVESVIEKTDIGGLSLLRSAAKARRIVMVSVQDWPIVKRWLNLSSPNEKDFLAVLASKAELVCAQYSFLSGSFYLHEVQRRTEPMNCRTYMSIVVDKLINQCDQKLLELVA